MVSEKEVYDTLAYHWQATRTIRKKIADSKDTKVFNIPIGRVIVCLDSLVSRGLAETQEREPNEEEFARAGNKVREYKKTSYREPAFIYEKL